MSDRSPYDGTTTTLLVEAGKKPGQPIASYVVGTRRTVRYLVFMPVNAPVGKNVRVMLTDQGRRDTRGAEIFKAYPAPVEYTERWKDNGDETISLVKIATDWLLQETEDDVLDIRLKEKKEGSPRTKDTFSVQWGTSLEMTFLVNDPIQVYPLLEEEVVNGEITWKQYGERQESLPQVLHQATAITITSYGWNTTKLQVHFPDDLNLNVQINYGENRWTYQNFTILWVDLPQWWKDQHDMDYPVCACNRQRREKQADGYEKCEQCRKEEHCIRCNKQGTVKNFSGRLVCSTCEPYEEAENLINTLIPLHIRQKLAQQAVLLVTAQPIERQVAHTILQSINGQDSNTFSQWIKTRDFPWYYFTEEGIFGSRFPQAALYVLSSLADASGNGFVEIMAWFHPGPNDYYNSTDFYTLTQVQGQQAKLPSMKDMLEKMARLELGVAQLVRASEQQRIDAEESVNKAKEDLVQCTREAGDLLKRAEEALSKFDYQLARELIQEARMVEAAFIQPVSLPQLQVKEEKTVEVRDPSQRIHQLRVQLNKIEGERITPNRVEVTFVLNPSGKLEAVTTWSGTVKKRSGGWLDIESEEVTFTCEAELVNPGERWLCKPVRQVGYDDMGRYRITVEPLIRSDQEEAMRAEIEDLRKKVKDAQRPIAPSSTSAPNDEDESPMAAAFKAAQNKRK